MQINVFGLGYVGCVSVACFGKEGHRVNCIDINDYKIGLINQGKPTIIEKDLDWMMKEAWEAGNIHATRDYRNTIPDTDISIICVGTPNNKHGHLDLSGIDHVAENIGEGLAAARRFHVVVIRSTVLPGTNEKVGRIIEEKSGKRRGTDFEVVSNPEFLREGSAVHDFYNPPCTVIGTASSEAFEIMKDLYQNVPAPVRRVSIPAAEMIKMVNNSFHALKVSFANEIGNICKSLGIDSHEVMDLFCEDTKLNLSPYYLKPGFAYGGSCLPKDLSALKTIAHDHYVVTPVINAIEISNENQKKRLIELVMEQEGKRIGVLGLSFKPGTDDLRHSPIVEFVEAMLGKGYAIRIYDKNVHLSKIVGANKEYIMAKIPHISDYISDNLDGVVQETDLVVIAHKNPEFVDLPKRYPDKLFIDLVRIAGDISAYQGAYCGISW